MQLPFPLPCSASGLSPKGEISYAVTLRLIPTAAVHTPDAGDGSGSTGAAATERPKTLRIPQRKAGGNAAHTSLN